MASDTTLIYPLPDANNGKTQIIVCHLPSSSSSTTASSLISAAMSIPMDSNYEIITMAEILPASFLRLGYSVHDPDGIMFTSRGPDISLLYRMIDYSPVLPNATRLKFPFHIASHIPLIVDFGVTTACLIDRYIVGAQNLRNSNRFYIKGSVNCVRPPNADPPTLEAPVDVQIARIHGGRNVNSIEIDAWRGCVYVTFRGEGQVIHVYDFVDPVI